MDKKAAAVVLGSRLKEMARRTALISSEERAAALREVDESQAEDLALLGDFSKDRPWAYREALKQEYGQAAICGVCEQSPWKIRKGKETCTACGNALS
jgi:mobilome CxxCx(11)CxxC protein